MFLLLEKVAIDRQLSYSLALLHKEIRGIWLLNNRSDVIKLDIHDQLHQELFFPFSIYAPLHPNFPVYKTVLEILFCELVDSLRRFFFDGFHMLSNLAPFSSDLIFTLNRSHMGLSGASTVDDSTREWCVCQECLHRKSWMGLCIVLVKDPGFSKLNFLFKISRKFSLLLSVNSATSRILTQALSRTKWTIFLNLCVVYFRYMVARDAHRRCSFLDPL